MHVFILNIFCINQFNYQFNYRLGGLKEPAYFSSDSYRRPLYFTIDKSGYLFLSAQVEGWRDCFSNPQLFATEFEEVHRGHGVIGLFCVFVLDECVALVDARDLVATQLQIRHLAKRREDFFQVVFFHVLNTSRQSY